MPRTVVITRPQAQAQALAQRVAALGLAVRVLPLLEISTLPDLSALDAALAELPAYALVAFVSPNAIDALFARAGAWPAGVAIAVLGEGSRAALAAHGVTEAQARIVSPPDPAHSDSEHLLQALDLAALRGRRVLIVRGENGRDLLAEALIAAGALVTQVAAYRRSVPVLTAQLATTLRSLLVEENDWILTSSEALRGLMDLLAELDAQDGGTGLAASAVAKMQHQHVIVPHARIAQTARSFGLARLTLTGSGDERVLAALQSRP